LVSELSQEILELRKDRENLNLNKTDSIIAFSRDLEEERTKRRLLAAELDTNKFRVKCLEEDL